MSMRAHVGNLTFGVFAVATALMAVGCGSSDTPTSPSTTTPVSFATQIQAQIFNPGCVPCHTDEGRTPSGGMVLKPGAAYASLVGVASSGKAGAVRVIPGNPSGSYLIQKLEGAPDIVGARMPRNGPPFLSDAQVALIRQWIQNGAPNN
jgi:mono/diheme cytochrome c family protein